MIGEDRDVPANPREHLMTPDPAHEAAFDAYAEAYDEALGQGLAVSGEDKSYFARGRIAWLAGCLGAAGFAPQAVLDYGCGTGSAVPYFFELLRAKNVVGVDPSPASVDKAERTYGSGRVRFFLVNQGQPGGDIDLAFCNGVFHHIPPEGRAAAVDYVYSSLRPGGLFALWENNPWNPGTRYVMSRIPFDRDAVPLTPPGARGLLRAGGFEVVRTDYLFIFPRVLRWLRWLEPLVARLPFGAQYQVLCRKPSQGGIIPPTRS
jgi:SAM-dependent methyltransferase